MKNTVEIEARLLIGSGKNASCVNSEYTIYGAGNQLIDNIVVRREK